MVELVLVFYTTNRKRAEKERKSREVGLGGHIIANQTLKVFQ